MVTRSGLAVSAAILMVPLALNAIICSACSTAGSGLSVFAAAGAKPPLDEICRKFGEQCENMVEISYGGGGEVLNQMILSRSGDVYIAPEQRFMEMALSKQAIDPETINDIAYMVPVIAVKKGNPKNLVSLNDLAKPEIRVAVTRVETTLLGKYAPEIFEKAGLAEAIESLRSEMISIKRLLQGPLDVKIKGNR